MPPSAVYDGGFTTISGERQTVEMMTSEESVYLDDGRAIGFVKPYKDRKYSFAALLPNEGVDIYDYIAGLTAEDLQNTLNSAKSEQVIATLPKFSYAYGLRMNNVLASLGMPTAFDGAAADFSGIVENGSLYIGEVLHKTFISVDARGTKAAVTIVETKGGSARQDKVVVLDRPFVYMILDNATNLPIFLGVVTDVEKN